MMNISHFEERNLGDFSSYAHMIMPAEWDDMQMQIDSIC